MSFRIAAALGAAWLAVGALAGSAHAHEGHDHGAPPPPVSKSIAPRGEAVSDAFELTAIPGGGKVTLYLDRFRTNEPVRGATVAVETPEGQETAVEADAGAYVLPAPWLAKAGPHDLLVTVTAGDAVDVLTVPLTMPETNPPAFAAPGETAAAKASAGLADLRARLAAKDPVLMMAVSAAFLLGLAVAVLARGRRSVPVLAVMAVAVTLALGTVAFAR